MALWSWGVVLTELGVAPVGAGFHTRMAGAITRAEGVPVPQALPGSSFLSLGTTLPAACNFHAGKEKISKTSSSTALPRLGYRTGLPGGLQDGHSGRGHPTEMITETVGVFSPVLARHHLQAWITPGWRCSLSPC